MARVENGFDPDWVTKMECAKLPVEYTDPLFFQGEYNRKKTEEAKAICKRCNVQKECQKDALEAIDKGLPLPSVQAGLHERELKMLWKRNNPKAALPTPKRYK